MNKIILWVVLGALALVAGLTAWIVRLRSQVAEAQSKAKIANAVNEITHAMDKTELNRAFDAAKATEDGADKGLGDSASLARSTDAAFKTEDANALDADLARRGFK